jgi:hypothetical protein
MALWLKKIHPITVLANPQFPDRRHFGQNPETIRFLYLQRCRTSGAISSYSTVIIRQFDIRQFHISSFDNSTVWHSTIRQFDSSTVHHSTVRQFDVSTFIIISNFRKSTALPQIKSSVANYVAMWFKKNHHLTVLANSQFPDWRHFGQNPETIRFLYLIG